MRSSIVPMEYPGRRFPPGKSPLLKRSIHHNCKLGDFVGMLDAVGQDVYTDVMNNSAIGVILKLNTLSFVWCGSTVHHFITNQLQIDKFYEIWSLIGGRPVRFSLHEFEEITKMNCDQIDDEEVWDVDHTDFWTEIGVNTGDGPNWYELRDLFDKCRTWTTEKRKRIALLFILHVGVFGLARTSRLPLMAAKRVMDLEAFEKYPWGRESFTQLMKSIQVAKLDGNSYAIHGCVHALLVWMYEAVPILGEKFGKRREGQVPLLRWASSRTRYNFEKVLEEDKGSNANKKVRVRHLVVKPLEEIYPPWKDEEDKKLDNMIRDILGGCLDETFWELQTPGGKQRKRKAKVVVEESEDDFVEKPLHLKEKKKDKAVESEKKKQKVKHGKRKMSPMRKMSPLLTSSDEETESEDVDMSIPLKDILKKKTVNRTESRSGEGASKIQKVEESGEVVKLLNKLLGKMDAFDDRIASLEGKRGKAPEAAIDPLVDEASKVGCDGNASGEKDLSWMVEQQATSHPDFPINRVIRNPTVNVAPNILRKVKCEPGEQKKKSQPQKRVDISELGHAKPTKPATVQKKEPTQRADISKLGQVKKPTKPAVQKKEPTQRADISELGQAKKQSKPAAVQKKESPKHVDISDEVTSSSEEKDKAISKALSSALDKLLKLSQNDDDFVVGKGRTKTLASSQVSPFIGHSATIRLIKGVIPSPTIYDPFAKVDKDKADRLVEFVRKDLENPFDTSLADVEWYLTMMTPKHMWPEDTHGYGWLNTSHMEAGFNMLRKRSLQRPTPFRSERIAFVDPIFTALWCQDYKKDFIPAEKKWVFTSGYFDMYNGLTPADAATNKKWVEDVDTLYIAHNIRNEHWVAVVVDLVKKTVKAYDSILNLYSDDYVSEECRAYTKMIPLLLKQAAPADKRQKMKVAAFNFYRIKSIPQNHQSGDCGVYTLKFIECLALGHAMDGLCDATMPAIRMKLAAEILDEIREEEMVQLSDPNPRGRSEDRVPLLTDSGN